MKRNFRFHVLIWAIFLGVFQIIVFLVRPIILEDEAHYDTRFWTAWLFIVGAFVGNLLCANKAFRTDTREKLFYKVPLITVSNIGMTVMLVLAGILMLSPNCPVWITTIVCIVVTAFTAVVIIKIDWGGTVISVTHEKAKVQTQFIRSLTVDAETLLGKAKTSDAKKAAQEVYEALQYSDPMSSEMLGEIETELAKKFKAFETSLISGKNVTEAADYLLKTLAERNNKCKMMK